MKDLILDTSQTGFQAVLTEWQIQVLRTVWGNPNGVNSRATCQEVNRRIQPETISRASVINFLEDMREMGVLKGHEKSGKGGYHWIYFPEMDEEGFKKFIVKRMIDTLMRSFPDETREAMRH